MNPITPYTGEGLTSPGLAPPSEEVTYVVSMKTTDAQFSMRLTISQIREMHKSLSQLLGAGQ